VIASARVTIFSGLPMFPKGCATISFKFGPTGEIFLGSYGVCDIWAANLGKGREEELGTNYAHGEVILVRIDDVIEEIVGHVTNFGCWNGIKGQCENLRGLIPIFVGGGAGVVICRMKLD